MLTSCGHIFTKGHTYQESQTVTINGAQIGSSVKPMGGKSGFAFSAMVYMAASASLDGPFLWRIVAEGKEEEHVEIIVHRIQTTTSKTKRSEWYPAEHLDVVSSFQSFKEEPGKVYANFQVPGKLNVYPREDGDITMLVDISVVAQKRTQRKLVKFALRADTLREKEFINLPAEIIKGRSSDPLEWNW